jgi:hypothetical protein
VDGLYATLAGGIVLLHLAFVAFAVAGGLLALRWPRLAFVHLPCAAWAAYVELTGRLCPLTPLENRLRARAGLDAYSTDFVAQYLFPVLYPEGLTRDAQVVIGLAVAGINAAVYGWVSRKRSIHRRAGRLPDRVNP